MIGMFDLRNFLSKNGGFWIGFTAVAILTYVGSALSLVFGLSSPVFAGVGLVAGTLVLAVLLFRWMSVHWARKKLREIVRAGGDGRVQIVWIGELGKWTTKTFVLELESEQLILWAAQSRMAIPFLSVDKVEVRQSGPGRADTTVVYTNTVGPIEITVIRADAIVPLYGGSTRLAEQLAEYTSRATHPTVS